MSVKPIPDGYHTVTPYLIIKNAAAAIDFYVKAFGAAVVLRLDGPDGKIAHAEIKIGDSIIMLGEENPAWDARSPETLGGSPTGICLYVEDVNARFSQAV